MEHDEHKITVVKLMNPLICCHARSINDFYSNQPREHLLMKIRCMLMGGTRTIFFNESNPLNYVCDLHRPFRCV